MKTKLALLGLIGLCSGCVASRTAVHMIDPDVIRALSVDTNSIELTVTSPTFGTVNYRRNLPPTK